MNETNVRVILRLLGMITVVYGGFRLTMTVISWLAFPSDLMPHGFLWEGLLASAATVGWGAFLFAKARQLAACHGLTAAQSLRKNPPSENPPRAHRA